MQMDEAELKQSLELYHAQLAQIEEAIITYGETEDLQRLQADLKEIISLTEGSLLSLKKSQLLKTLEDAESGIRGDPSGSLDDEYAAFQAAVQTDLAGTDTSFKANTQQPSTSAEGMTSNKSSLSLSSAQVHCNNESDSSDESESSADDKDESSDDNVAIDRFVSSVDKELSNLIGMKCRAPFSYEWGGLDYHNALITSVSKDWEQSDKIMVNVMFTTPTHSSMLPCKFYLDGHCRFSDDQCRYSHGHTVQVEQLREFVEADHSKLAVGTKCLACYTDCVWYPATITDIKDETVSVHFDNYGEDMDLDIASVVPIVQGEDMNDDIEEGQATSPAQAEQGRQSDAHSDDEELPVFLWKPPQTTAAVGEWEAHTRGIGSKLMAQMGYVHGQGLGLQGQGKADLVPIMLLPQGKSLDRIMELKEMAGDASLFDAMKKMEKQKKKADKRREEQASKTDADLSARPPSVFDFINRKLVEQKGDHSTPGMVHTHSSGTPAKFQPVHGNRRTITEHDLHKKSDRDINVQLLQTHEEIRSVERHIDKLRQSLARNVNKDKSMATQIKARLAEQEIYLTKLQTSSSALEKHQRKRSDSKKLVVF